MTIKFNLSQKFSTWEYSQGVSKFSTLVLVFFCSNYHYQIFQWDRFVSIFHILEHLLLICSNQFEHNYLLCRNHFGEFNCLFEWIFLTSSPGKLPFKFHSKFSVELCSCSQFYTRVHWVSSKICICIHCMLNWFAHSCILTLDTVDKLSLIVL